MKKNNKNLKNGSSPTGVPSPCCALSGREDVSALDVCNVALGLLGRDAIVGFGGSSQASQHCALMYHPARKCVLRDFGVEGNLEELSEWSRMMLEAFVIKMAWVLSPVGKRDMWASLYQELVSMNDFTGINRGGRH